MSQHLVQLAEQVKTTLTATIGGVPLTPVRAWFVVEELETKTVDELNIWIIPVVSQPSEYLDRSRTNYTPIISVVMQQKLSVIANSLIDPLVILSGQIMEFFRDPANRSFSVPGEGGWTLDGPEYRDGTVLIPDHIYNLRQFTSVMDLTFRLVA